MMNRIDLAPTAARHERTSRRFWVLLILGFFGMDLSIAIIAIAMAAGDPSFRAIPGFGERSVAWDERRALSENWQKQNWTLDVSRRSPGSDAVEFSLRSEDGQPVTGCSGNVKVFHYTRVAEQSTASVDEVAPGIYVAPLNVAKPGMWNVEFDLFTMDTKHCWTERSFDWSKPTEGSIQSQGTMP
ncbi:MAG: FixH family protein [Pirellula sp.]